MKFLLITAGAALAFTASAYAQQPDPNAAQPKGEVPATVEPLVPANPNVPKDSAAPVGSPANPVVVGGNMTPPPAPQAEYPLCTRTLKDQCRNPGWRREA